MDVVVRIFRLQRDEFSIAKPYILLLRCLSFCILSNKDPLVSATAVSEELRSLYPGANRGLGRAVANVPLLSRVFEYTVVSLESRSYLFYEVSFFFGFDCFMTVSAMITKFPINVFGTVLDRSTGRPGLPCGYLSI